MVNMNNKLINLKNIHEQQDKKVHPSTYIKEHSLDKPGKVPILEELSKRRATVSQRASITFMPNKSHDLIDWLDFPRSSDFHVVINCMTLPFKWLLWTNKGLSGLTPGSNLRERLCNQSTSLGSVAGLYLVVAISAFLTPPHYESETDRYLIHAYGVIMFGSAMFLTVYLCIALTVMYPLLESIPDFAAVQAHRNLEKKWGGYEQFFFNLGCQCTMIALLIAAKVLYSEVVVYWMIGIFFVMYCTAAFFTREFFVAIDPITSLHMGICNCDDTYNKATRLADEISKQHAAFAEDPETLDEWKAVNYMVSPRNESRKKVFEEHHITRISNSPRESPKVTSSRKSAGGNRVAVDGVEEVGVGMHANVGPIVEQEWSDDEPIAPAVSSAKRRGVSDDRVESVVDDVASYTNDNEYDGNSTKYVSPSQLGGSPFKGAEHNIIDLDEDLTQSSSVTPLPRVSAKNGHSLPSLQSIFLGSSPLIMRVNGGSTEYSTMGTMDAKKVYGILRKESCRDTQHLISLLRWRLGDLKHRHNGEHELNEKLMSILVDMGMPVFLAMEVAEYMKQYL